MNAIHSIRIIVIHNIEVAGFRNRKLRTEQPNSRRHYFLFDVPWTELLTDQQSGIADFASWQILETRYPGISVQLRDVQHNPMQLPTEPESEDNSPFEHFSSLQLRKLEVYLVWIVHDRHRASID
jgi:hypothetical protein